MEIANETLEQLEFLIGKENAEKVFNFFKGLNIYFPKSIGLRDLHNKIFAELQGGAAYRDVARKYGYTKSYIRKIEHKKNEERREARARSGAVTGPSAAIHEGEIKLAPRDVKPFEQGDLFYEG
jgi:Mor family transcriptional regulator